MSLESGKKFCAEYASRGTAGCKKCKTKIDKGLLRIGRIVPNPFTDAGGEMKECRARATTKIIEEAEDIDGFQNLELNDRKLVLSKIDELQEHRQKKAKPLAKKAARSPSSPSKVVAKKVAKTEVKSEPEEEDSSKPTKNTENLKDNAFKEFRRLCRVIHKESSYNGKTTIVKEFLEKGTSGKKFEGDTFLWVKFLLPMVDKRIYNLQSKQLCKLFARIFGGSVYDSMIEHLENGDVAETIAEFHGTSKRCAPIRKAILSLHEVDRLLEELSQTTREDDQAEVLEKIARKCTSNDLRMVVRLIKHDIKINAGPKHILGALNAAAYEAFQASLDLKEVVRESLAGGFDSTVMNVGIKLCTPVRPMLAEPCRSVEFAFNRCPKGILTEVKYDGERVQLHKQGNKFLYFSRSLKPVVEHKVKHFSAFIPKAFPKGDSLIIDGEILLVNTKTDELLSFGTLGIHKKQQFEEASVCLFVFDCLFYNGISLLGLPLIERREILLSQMTEIKHHVMLSEMENVTSPKRLREKIKDAINAGLEGLVLKDPQSKYEPGKRHWMKVKKDYLEEGSMADSADLVVLGAYFGTGNKGGMMSIFLMGCLNEKTQRWVTVTKVHTGHDEQTLKKLQKTLKMTKISKNHELVPDWLDVKSQLTPDFVAKNPFKSQVWKITGAEFSKAETHTANGISIRFPRVTEIRDDKSPKEATTLAELENLLKASKEQVLKLDETVGDDVEIASDDDDDKPRRFNGQTDDNEDTGDEAEQIETSSKSGKRKASRAEIGSGSSLSRPKARLPEQSPRKKIKVEPSSPLLTNPHTVDDTASADTKRSMERGRLPPCDLPNVFNGICIQEFPNDRKMYGVLRRYFVAYGGTFSERHVTHRIGTSKGTTKVEWLLESIKRRRLLDCAQFKN